MEACVSFAPPPAPPSLYQPPLSWSSQWQVLTLKYLAGDQTFHGNRGNTHRSPGFIQMLRLSFNSVGSAMSECHLSRMFPGCFFFVLLIRYLNVCRVALSVRQSAQRLSFVRHVTFANRLQRRWKSHLTSFRVELLGVLWSFYHLCPSPRFGSAPPHFTASDTLTEIKLPKCWPPSQDSFWKC